MRLLEWKGEGFKKDTLSIGFSLFNYYVKFDEFELHKKKPLTA